MDDQGKEGPSNNSKKKKMDQEELDEQERKRLKSEHLDGLIFLKRCVREFRNREKKQKEEKEDSDEELLLGELEGTSTEVETEEETVLSPVGSSTNNLKGIKKKKKNVEQAADNNPEEVPSVMSPAGSSTNNPKGIKEIKLIHEEEEEEKEEKKPKAADSSSADTCTSTFRLPTSPIDKSLDSGKDESMKSPPGDQGSGCSRKNL